MDALKMNWEEILCIIRVENTLLPQWLREQTSIRQDAERALSNSAQVVHDRDAIIQNLKVELRNKNDDYDGLDNYTEELRQRYRNLESDYEQSHESVVDLQEYLDTCDADMENLRSECQAMRDRNSSCQWSNDFGGQGYWEHNDHMLTYECYAMIETRHMSLRSCTSGVLRWRELCAFKKSHEVMIWEALRLLSAGGIDQNETPISNVESKWILRVSLLLCRVKNDRFHVTISKAAKPL